MSWVEVKDKCEEGIVEVRQVFQDEFAYFFFTI